MITSPDLEFIMEAHNGVSAKIVEEAGNYGDVVYLSELNWAVLS